MLRVTVTGGVENCKNFPINIVRQLREHYKLRDTLYLCTWEILRLVLWEPTGGNYPVEYTIEITLTPTLEADIHMGEAGARIWMRVGPVINFPPITAMALAGKPIPELAGATFITLYVKHWRELKPIVVKNIVQSLPSNIEKDRAEKTLRELPFELMWPWPLLGRTFYNLARTFLGYVTRVTVDGEDVTELVKQNFDAVSIGLSRVSLLAESTTYLYSGLITTHLAPVKYLLERLILRDFLCPTTIMCIVASATELVENALGKLAISDPAGAWKLAYMLKELVDTTSRVLTRG